MANPRTPLAKAKLTGADKKNPQRFRDRSEPETSGKSVGAPPAYLGKEAKAAWREFSKELGWLEYEDRCLLEVASVCRGQIRDLVRAGEIVPASMLSAANTAIGKLGASPVDRSKIFQKSDEPDPADPFAAFGVQ